MSLSPKYLELFVYAKDADNALELLGNGADLEYSTFGAAVDAFDPEYHAGKGIYKVVVTCEVEDGGIG